MSNGVAGRDDGASSYLTVSEAAALLRVSGAAITKWLRNGKLRGRKLGLRRWRVERASVEAALPSPQPTEPTPLRGPEPPFEHILALLPLLDEDARRQLAIAALSVVDDEIATTRREIVAAHERYTEEAQ